MDQVSAFTTQFRVQLNVFAIVDFQELNATLAASTRARTMESAQAIRAYAMLDILESTVAFTIALSVDLYN